jgi:hypothetical protein
MSGYDPKRPRPSAASEDDPPPVDALLEPVADEPRTPDEPTPSPSPSAAGDAPGDERPEADELSDARVEVDLRETSSNGSSARAGHEVPVAAAPEEGTTNRAVLVAAVSGVTLVVLVLAVLLRRRRRRG